MPSPYRKSCQQCVKAKRRCDLKSPCYRCRVRSLRCTYEKTRAEVAASAEVDAEVIAEVDAEVDVEVDWTQLPSPPTLTMAVIGDGLDAPMPVNETNGYNAAMTDKNSALPYFPDYNLDWSDVMQNIDSFVVPDQIGANNTAPDRSVLVGEIYQERIIYGVKTLKSWPGLYAERGHIPFVHSHLYARYLPSVVQEALGVCSLYAHKNDRNERLVARCISQAARNMVSEPDKLDTLSPIELLASVQVLCLYQIIRLFDGNVLLRAEGEAAMSLFDRWLRHLKHRAKPVDSELQDVISKTFEHDVWWEWVFDESVRRTLIVGFTIEGLYSFVKEGWDASHHDFADLSFYAQRALWVAPSEYYWRTTIKDTRLLPIRFPMWDTDIADAQPEDMEELGMIMLAFVKGVDHCRQWVGKEAHGRFGLSLPDLDL